MRRSLAAILTVLFSWMLILPVFAPAFGSKLPACCLKSGKHHCMMRAMAAGSSANSTAAIDQKCPFSSQATVASHVGTGTATVAAAVFAGMVSHPSGLAKTEAGYRVSFHRARQKRGPPALFLNS
jgi:hypothetical protein